MPLFACLFVLASRLPCVGVGVRARVCVSVWCSWFLGVFLRRRRGGSKKDRERGLRCRTPRCAVGFIGRWRRGACGGACVSTSRSYPREDGDGDSHSADSTSSVRLSVPVCLPACLPALAAVAFAIGPGSRHHCGLPTPSVPPGTG